MTKEGAIATIIGWPESAVTRDRKGRVLASWFPVNAKQVVIFSGANKAKVDGKLPMSKALEEEYRDIGIPLDAWGDQRQAIKK